MLPPPKQRHKGKGGKGEWEIGKIPEFRIFKFVSLYTIEDVYFDIAEDIYNSTDPEYRNAIHVPEQTLIIQTSHKTLSEFVTFFEFIRQSLRNIVIDIDKYNNINKLLCTLSAKRLELGKPLTFISHDSRDKYVASSIAIGLMDIKCPVWYDEDSLKVGDNLRESIEKGLKECRKYILSHLTFCQTKDEQR